MICEKCGVDPTRSTSQVCACPVTITYGDIRQPYKCPCCDGWGKRADPQFPGVQVNCIPCGGEGIIWK